MANPRLYKPVHSSLLRRDVSIGMILRTASRSLLPQVRAQFRQEAEQLQLPFLCPILYKPAPQSRKTSSLNRPPVEVQKKSPRYVANSRHDRSTPATRGLASAAAAAEYDASPEDFVPFDIPQYSQHNNADGLEPQQAYPLQGFDFNPTPLILDDTPPPLSSPSGHRPLDGVSGDINEIHQTLHACLQVGRLERAAALVRRLSAIYKADAPGLFAAHKSYLQECAMIVMRTKDNKILQNMLAWVEVEMRPQGIPLDASMFALVIQACLQDYNRKRSARAVRRYYKFAREAGVEQETKELVPELERVLEQMTSLLESKNAAEPSRAPPESALKPAQITIPELRPVEIKGQGLTSLRKSLESLNEGQPSHMGSEKIFSTLADADRQRLLEQRTVDIALERWQAENEQMKKLGIHHGNIHGSGSNIGAVMWSWHEELLDSVKEELRLANEAERKEARDYSDKERLQWGPYLQTIPPEKLSALTILSTMNTVAHGEMKATTILHHIGRAIVDESYAITSRKARKNPALQVISKHKANVQPLRNAGLADNSESSVNHTDVQAPINWPESVRFKIAAMLFSKLIEAAQVPVSRTDPRADLAYNNTITETQPVFFHTYQYRSGKRVGVVRLNAALTEKMSQSPVGSALAKHLPMVCEPKPWVGFKEGGFLEHTTKAVRFHEIDRYAMRYARTAAANGDMFQVFAGLDALGKTAWKVNRAVFDVMAEAWNTGEAIASIPPEKPDLEQPPEPSSSEMKEHIAWIKLVQEIENKRRGLVSDRCFQNFQMEVARSFIHERFYFPHNVDFRGRAYPMAPFLNHMGADNCRGLLQFADGKELGERGLWWLKIHLANKFGYDKASFQERFFFVEEHLPDILDSANNAMGGRRWWLQAEDPWQCLATCIELRDALQLPDPTKFRSGLPIHQDGSCNGLQHYAALGGDTAGAKQVNLQPGDRPSDIYTAVAEIVKAEVKAEAAGGNSLAQALDQHISRKVVKQTVMTNVYGVTFIGAKRQVRKQLEDLNLQFAASDDSRNWNLESASTYIARKIFTTLASMFNGAHDIQHWFGECASKICQSVSPGQIKRLGQARHESPAPSVYKRQSKLSKKKIELTTFITPVMWTTPLKMPVCQPYRKESVVTLTTHLQRVSLHKQGFANTIDRARQCQGFPPNFIHSLDGTHMFLTALKCQELGLTFASVHDSFWTHAADIDTMNTVTRDAFIRMHSEDIISRLASEFQVRYKDHMQEASVATSSAVGIKIRSWRQRQALEELRKGLGEGRNKLQRKQEELLLEIKRLRLLRSSDAKEREEGMQMVTPGSILADAPEHERVPSAKIVASSKPSKSSRKKGRPGKVKPSTEEMLADEDEAGDSAVANGVGEDEVDLKADNDERTALEAGQDVETEFLAAEKEEDETESPKVYKGRKTMVWMPLTFPPVPQRGDFDVSKVRDSPYFFS